MTTKEITKTLFSPFLYGTSPRGRGLTVDTTGSQVSEDNNQAFIDNNRAA